MLSANAKCYVVLRMTAVSTGKYSLFPNKSTNVVDIFLASCFSEVAFKRLLAADTDINTGIENTRNELPSQAVLEVIKIGACTILLT